MTKNSKQVMSAFALSAAALFLGGCEKQQTEPQTENPESKLETPPAVSSTGGADEVIKCFGINECRGQSVCNVNKPELGIEHACAGENECRGKGWIKVARSECDEKGGEVLG